MNKLHKLDRLLKSHRFQSQVEAKAAKHFGRNTTEFKQYVEVLQDIVNTHEKARRRNGDFRKQHEFNIAAMGFEYMSEQSLGFHIGLAKHDMNEDYRRIWPLCKIRQCHGRIASRVVYFMTAPIKIPGESKDKHAYRKFQKVERGGIEILKAKIIDRTQNLYSLKKSGPLCKQESYIKETKEHILPWVKELNFMKDEFTDLLQREEVRIKRGLKRRKK